MLKIWGRKTSSNVQKVLWCCGELEIPFERVDLGGEFGGNREQPYLDLNPNGVVPTIEDGDFVLWESNSIVRYLINKYNGGKLVPGTPEGRGNANRWMDWQLTTLNTFMVPIFFGIVRTRKPNVTPPPSKSGGGSGAQVGDGRAVPGRPGLSRRRFLHHRRHPGRHLGVPLVHHADPAPLDAQRGSVVPAPVRAPPVPGACHDPAFLSGIMAPNLVPQVFDSRNGTHQASLPPLISHKPSPSCSLRSGRPLSDALRSLRQSLQTISEPCSWSLPGRCSGNCAIPHSRALNRWLEVLEILWMAVRSGWTNCCIVSVSAKATLEFSSSCLCVIWSGCSVRYCGRG